MSAAISAHHSATAARPPGVGRFDRLLFYLLAAILWARPLITETLVFEPELSFLSPLTGGQGPTPATTALLDGVLLVASVAALVRPGRTGRLGLFGLGTVLLTAAVVVSTIVAGDQRSAANAGANLIVLVLAALALGRLMRARWMAHLLLAGMLASGAAFAVKCLSQRTYEFEQTLEVWREHKQQLAAAGQDVADPTIVNYERRLQSAEAFGYLSHPNVAASCLTMWLLTGVGVLAGHLIDLRRRQTSEGLAACVLAMIVSGLLAVGLRLTGSAGGLVATLAGLLLLVFLGAARRWVAARARLVTTWLAVGYVAVIVAAIAYGVVRGTLPHASLAFRWHYWTAAARTIQDAPWTGIGRENFAAAFMRYKSPESPEEVRDPHNLWVTLLTELGPLGLAAGTLLVTACVAGMLRRLERHPAPAEYGERITPVRLALAASALLAVHATFSGTELRAAGVLVLWLIELGAVWLLGLVASTWLLQDGDDDGRRTAWLIVGSAAAVLAALIHNLIDFSLLTPAGLSIACAVAASAFVLRPASGERPRHEQLVRPARPAALFRVGLVALLASHLILVVAPTCRADLALRQMHRTLARARTSDQAATALRWGAAAVDLDRWNPATARQVARAALELSLREAAAPQRRLDWLLQARRLAQIAIARNPKAAPAYRTLARLGEELENTYMQLARPEDAVEALHETAANYEAASERYPTDARLRLSAGRCWFRVWADGGDAAAARAAAQHLAAALAIDDHRPPEEVVRLRPQERAELEACRQELRAAGFDSEATSPEAP